ncbi:hypothetical protein C4D60_Mb08t26270 [Musa balbisiana]|uniref:Uncharacterized protein n=1 Tax=Musa balbisiana TaxID=52838 RepID=A0A4S8K6N1_MUSBA|nr:hypothetical protein C4D60_Mb08t26270 [Musa balbisiana]
MWTWLSILSTPAWNSPSATCMTRCRTGKGQLTGRAKWYLSRCVIFALLGRAYPLSPGQQICGKREEDNGVGLWIEITIVPRQHVVLGCPTTGLRPKVELCCLKPRPRFI